MNKILELTEHEFARQRDTLNLIASENYPSPTVLNLLGSVWSNKYGEGYPGKRYYAGNENTDQLESLVQDLALKVYGASEEYGVNVQVLSGTPANAMVYLSVLSYGDTVLSINLDNGGHISHMHSSSRWLKFFKLANYDVKEVGADCYEIDVEDYEQKIKEVKPKLVIIGCSGYPRKYEFAKMCQIAHQNGCLVLADIAHINGLIAVDLHDSPFKAGELGADFVSMTTHKTFRGPRSAMLFARNYIPDYAKLSDFELASGVKNKQVNSLIEVINRTVFPGNSGGPHFNKIAAIGQACQEILGIEKYPDGISFKEYSQNVLDTCKAMENSLHNEGLKVISPTQNHLCLIKLPDEMDSLKIQNNLEEIGLVTNRNKVPFDTKTPWKPSGIRLGTAALTSRGLNNAQAGEIGKIIADTVFERSSHDLLVGRVQQIVKSLNWYY
jgi:glycine hydroxymethyltransferase